MGTILRKLSLIMLMVPVLTSACVSLQDPVSPMEEMLPRDTEVPGWTQQTRSHFSAPGPISMINGNFNVYGVSELSFARYSSISSEEQVIDVTIAKCDTVLNSFGIFSLERGFLPVRNAKDDQYASDDGLFFREGEYYVKLGTDNAGDARKDDLIVFMNIVAKHLRAVSSRDSLPRWIYTFSHSGTLADLVHYRYGSPLLADLKDVYVRKRIIDGKDTFIFFRHGATSADASDAFMSVMKNSQPAYTLSRLGNVAYAMKENPEGGSIFISYRDKLIYGVLNAETKAIGGRIIATLHSELSGI
jgi:hypothetical protein